MRAQCSWKLKQGVGSPGVMDGCETPCGCWELNKGPLEEHPVLLTMETSLQPSQYVSKGDLLDWLTGCDPGSRTMAELVDSRESGSCLVHQLDVSAVPVWH